MVTSALLLAGGVASRWNNHFGVAKHLAPMPNEPNIYRLQRKLVERGVDGVMVACKPEDVNSWLAAYRAGTLTRSGGS